MKRKTILKLIALLLILGGGISSCQKTASYFDNVWVCTPEPDVMITLTFDSLQNKAYVTTIPQNLTAEQYLSPAGKRYIFYNGDQYVVHGDTMDRIIDSICVNGGFIKTTLSSNSINLQSYNMLPVCMPPNPVENYLFTRKMK
jgi:hypothetical protein